MEWITLNSVADFDNLIAASEETPMVIYKHSSICSLSSIAKSRLERPWNEDDMGGVQIYFLNVIANLELSRHIQGVLEVRHESPQILLIRHGQCTCHTSHWGISYHDLRDELLPYQRPS